VAKAVATVSDMIMPRNINRSDPRSRLLAPTPPRRMSGMIPAPTISLTGHRNNTTLNASAAALDGNNWGASKDSCATEKPSKIQGTAP